MTESLQTRDGRSVLRMERRLAHPPEKVWKAMTEPERLAEWFPSKVVVELREGGKVDYDGGEPGVVTDLDPPRLIAYTWQDDHLRWELHPEGDGTRLVLLHTFDDRPGAASYGAGWHTCIVALGLALDGRPGADPGVDDIALHERLVTQLGLDAGTVDTGPDGWRVRHERQLTRPTDGVWGAVRDLVPDGEVVGEHALEHDAEEGGRVRWELGAGTGHGARLVLTHTGADGDPQAALEADGRRIAQLLDRLQAVPTGR
ncbi:MAG TPA: SRPBCC family protein [Pseudonocardia sp.]|uniref:SRPBCC family protein n=1 Tax=Pseudonocardia sp. TaxID=60912 RepID=UPI002B4AC07E|nr:SRPBCC family protein [Pseudonocardia sp.]HLU56784.1 SRPBCC family protein [Pseudonocardia sp.]